MGLANNESVCNIATQKKATQWPRTQALEGRRELYSYETRYAVDGYKAGQRM